MTTKEKPFYEQQYTAEERELAEHIIGLEKSALDKWFKGDTSGYERLWSKRSFTYFDAVVTERVDDHATIARFWKPSRANFMRTATTSVVLVYRSARIWRCLPTSFLPKRILSTWNIIASRYIKRKMTGSGV